MPNTQFVKPYNNDPFVGHLATPISASGFTKAFIGNLPAYRPGLSPLLRGLEVGMAHGYFLVGPWTLLGPLRDSVHANEGGLISALALVLIATIALSAHGQVTFQGNRGSKTDSLQSSEGWSQFSDGFFIGATGGAFVAYLLLSNFNIIDGVFRGTFH
jgi:photosystem I subunit XI